MIDELQIPEAYPASNERDFEPVFARESESERAADRAFAAASRGAWLHAARAFVEASRGVILSPGTPTWEIAARNRERFYRNAERCFLRASALDEAQLTFAALASADPYHGAMLRRLSEQAGVHR